MKPAVEAAVDDPLNAYTFVLAGLARLAGACETLDEGVRNRLLKVAARRVEVGGSLPAAFKDYLRHPAKADAALAKVARRFALNPVETLAVRLAIAAEQDLLIGHLLSHLQQPLALSRPAIGLVAQAYAAADVHNAVHDLGQGNAIRCGLLHLCGEDRPLPERQLRVPLPTARALQSMETSWPGTALIAFGQHPVPLGATAEARAVSLAARFRASGAHGPALVIRSGDSIEARAAAALVCSRASAGAVLIHTDQVLGMAPWLVLNHLLPVFAQWLTPGERKPVAVIPGYAGPLIHLTGPEGEFESDDRSVIDWRLGTPSVAEREALWCAAIGEPLLAGRLAAEHRHSAGRIAALAARAAEEGDGKTPPDYARIRAVSWGGVRGSLREGWIVGACGAIQSSWSASRLAGAKYSTFGV